MYGGIILVPGGVYGESLATGVKCGVGGLLDIVVNDVVDRVPKRG